MTLKEQSDFAFQVLVKSQMLEAPISLEDLMKYPITSVPASLGTPDGFMNKTNKATIVHHIADDDYMAEIVESSSVFFVYDVNAILHSMTCVPATFKEICLKVLTCAGQKKHVLFSIDQYLSDSIKAHERKRRGGNSASDLLINTNTRRPAEWKDFLCSDANKQLLFRLMLQVWEQEDFQDRKYFLVVDGEVHQFSESGHSVVNHLTSTQEETDTRTILYLKYAKILGFKTAVVRTPDSDLFIITLAYAHSLDGLRVLFDTGVGDHRRIIDIPMLAQDLGEERCSALLGLYVFSGEDTTSAFKGKGKVMPSKRMEKSIQFQHCIQQLGSSWFVTEEMETDIEKFVCSLYGIQKLSDVNVVRVLMMRQMVGGRHHRY